MVQQVHWAVEDGADEDQLLLRNDRNLVIQNRVQQLRHKHSGTEWRQVEWNWDTKLSRLTRSREACTLGPTPAERQGNTPTSLSVARETVSDSSPRQQAPPTCTACTPLSLASGMAMSVLKVAKTSEKSFMKTGSTIFLCLQGGCEGVRV